MASNIACLDTNVLIYATQPPGTSELTDRAHQLFQDLTQIKMIIAIPSIVVAEFTYGMTGATLVAASNALSSIRVLPFDYAAVQRYQTVNSILPPLTANGSKRRGLKFDRMIIATALAVNADCFYTNDDDCLGAANKCRLKSFGLPPLSSLQIPLIP